MGLSNTERLRYIYDFLGQITDPEFLAPLQGNHELPSRQVVEELLRDIGKLWPAFLRHKSDNTRWLFGSEVYSVVAQENSVLHQALVTHRESCQPDPDQAARDEFMKELRDKADSGDVEAQVKLEEKHLHDYQLDFCPSYLSILKRHHPMSCATVYQIFEWCQNVRYALHRYEDDFYAEHRELFDLTSSIIGHCYHVMASEPTFREAWYLAKISNKLVGEASIPPGSTIVRFWNRENFHHDITPGLHKLEELHDLWTKLQAVKTLSTEEAVLQTLWLVGRRLHYPHQLQDLVALLKRHNKNRRKDRVNIPKVERFFKKHNLAQYDKYMRRVTAGELHYCILTEQERA